MLPTTQHVSRHEFRQNLLDPAPLERDRLYLSVHNFRDIINDIAAKPGFGTVLRPRGEEFAAKWEALGDTWTRFGDWLADQEARGASVNFGSFLGGSTVRRFGMADRVGDASPAEIDATANNILLVATFWLNFSSVRGQTDEQEAIRHGIRQVMMLLSPFLRDAERLHLNTLSQAYVQN